MNKWRDRLVDRRTPAGYATLRAWAGSGRVGFTLVEMAVVAAIIVLLLALALPTLSSLTDVPRQGAVRTTLRGLFASARVQAMTTGKYTGVRFQKALTGQTFAVLVTEPVSARYVQPPPPATQWIWIPGDNEDRYLNYVAGRPFGAARSQFSDTELDWPNDPTGTYVALVTVKGYEPLALPKEVELAQGDLLDVPENQLDTQLTLTTLLANPNSLSNPGLGDSTTFTILFAPSGQVVRQRVFVGERIYQPQATSSDPPRRYDSVFNQKATDLSVPVLRRGLLLPDVDDSAKPTPEISQLSLWIYDRARREQAGQFPVTGYVAREGVQVHVNVYTGALIEN